MKSKLSERIKERRIMLGLSQDALAKRLGYTSRSSIAKIESGVNLLTQPRIEDFANALMVSPAYLMGWTDELNGAVEPSNVYPVEGIVAFDELGTVRAGYGGCIDEIPTGKKVDIPVSMLKGRPASEYFTLKVSGNSMYPKLLDGDTILCLRTDSVDSGCLAVVIYDGQDATVKKVNYVNGEDWLELVPANPEYETKRLSGYDLEQCRVIGKVVNLIREL